jgi:hypothetical protein
MPCLFKHNREHAFYSKCSSGGHTDVATFWYLYWQATYRLENLLEQDLVIRRMTYKWPSLLVAEDKLVPIIAFGSKFLVAFPPRSSWLSQETSEILPSDGVKAGWVLWGVLWYKGILYTEVYAILACCDYLRRANMHIMTICICSDSNAASLALSSYRISSINFYTSAGYHCKISLITTE